MSLDAAGHLLLAEGHLRKAKQRLEQRPCVPEDEDAMYTRLTIKGMAEIALTAVTTGLKISKEEPCKP